MTVDLGALVSVLNWAAGKTKDGRTFAFVLVPLGVLFYWWHGSGFLGSRPNIEDRVSVMPIRSQLVEGGGAETENGLIATFKAVDGEYRISLQDPPASIMTNLNQEQAVENMGQVDWRAGVVSVDMPLMGTGGPLTLVIDGEASGSLLQKSTRTPLSEISKHNNNRYDLLFACLLALFFSYGVTIGQFSGHRDRQEEML